MNYNNIEKFSVFRDKQKTNFFFQTEFLENETKTYI